MMSTPISYHSEVFCDMLIHLFLCPITEYCRHPCCSSGISVRSMSNGMLTGWGCPYIVLPAELASAKCIAVFVFCLLYLFIYLFVLFFLLLIVCLTGPQRWLC